MKKLFILLISLLMLSSCTKVPETEIQETDKNDNLLLATGTYQIFNSLGSKITELYLYETNLDKSDNKIGDNGLKDGDYVTLTYNGNLNSVLTIEYVCEDGDTGKYEALNLTETPINLIAKSQRVGESILEFVKPEGDGIYTIHNNTGGNVTELYLYESSSNRGENYASEGLASGDEIELTYRAQMDAVLTLEFITDTGDSGIFKTLKMETVPIWLLSEDARTGATAVSFIEPKY